MTDLEYENVIKEQIELFKKEWVKSSEEKKQELKKLGNLLQEISNEIKLQKEQDEQGRKQLLKQIGIEE